MRENVCLFVCLFVSLLFSSSVFGQFGDGPFLSEPPEVFVLTGGNVGVAISGGGGTPGVNIDVTFGSGQSPAAFPPVPGSTGNTNGGGGFAGGGIIPGIGFAELNPLIVSVVDPVTGFGTEYTYLVDFTGFSILILELPTAGGIPDDPDDGDDPLPVPGTAIQGSPVPGVTQSVYR